MSKFVLNLKQRGVSVPAIAIPMGIALIVVAVGYALWG